MDYFLGIDIIEESGIKIDEEFEGFLKTFETIGILISGIFGTLFNVLIPSVIFIFIAKIAQSDVSFRQLFSMNTYIMIISALGSIVSGLYFALFGGDRDTLPTSLGSILNYDGAVGTIFNSLEIFAVWRVILTVFGLREVARFPKGLAWSISIILFLIGVLLSILTPSAESVLGV